MRLGRFVTQDGFFEDAAAMRRMLDRGLADTTDPFDPRRFVWERWHVDGQFSQLRTPARAFFGEELCAAFEARLLRWAGPGYGCTRLGGPPWLSILTDGGFQSLHRDGPNGQIAFTFGLGKNGRFRGGETLIARDELLDYFGTGSHREEVAHTPLFDEVAPRMNRLVAFDSRIPHAVRTVEGPRHPRDGRIAVQGWIAAAGVATSDFDVGEATRSVNEALAKLGTRGIVGHDGLVAVRIEVKARGRVHSAEIRASTLARTRGDAPGEGRVLAKLTQAVSRARFAGAGRLTAPVIVRPGKAPRVPSNG